MSYANGNSDELISLEIVITEFIAWVLLGLQVLRRASKRLSECYPTSEFLEIKVLAGELQT